jgi:small subunit ribosomal protein S5
VQKRDQRDNRQQRRSEEDSGLIEKTIHINRVAKVVKGGRRFSFSALVVVGDGQGNVAVAHGKANEVPEAIRKATERAKASMEKVPLREGTVPHTVMGKFGASQVILRPAAPGTGIIAGANARAILDCAGYHNVLTKVVGSRNAHNVVRATMDALRKLESPEQYASRVNKSMDQVLPSYNVGSHVWQTSVSDHTPKPRVTTPAPAAPKES